MGGTLYAGNAGNGGNTGNGYSYLKNPYTVNLCNVLRSVTSNIGLLKIFHKGYPECSRYILTLICIDATQSVVTIMFLDFQ